MSADGWRIETCARRPGAKKAKCIVCNGGFVLNTKKGWDATPVAVRERQVSAFRGDDEVDFAHPGCLSGAVKP